MNDETPTILRVEPIDYNAPGSLKLERDRRRLSTEYLATIAAYNDAADAFNAARTAMLDQPDAASLLSTLETAANALQSARDAMNVAREAYHAHLMTRMTTNDGTSVSDALDRISMNDFTALVTHDVETVVIPKVGAAN